jgi:putative DNA primase/helicase
MTNPNNSSQKISSTDVGNARRMVKLFGKDMRYCHGWGQWLVWNGVRWQEDTTGEIERRAKETARAIYIEASRAKTQEKREKLAAWAIKSESERAIKAMINLARSEPGIPIRPAELDANAYQLNCLNGTIDLRTGKLHRHRREDLITKLAPVKYDPKARDQMWEKVLNDATGANTELEELLQRAFGYSITGDTGEEVLFLVYGPEASSKSTIVEAIKATLAITH